MKADWLLKGLVDWSLTSPDNYNYEQTGRLNKDTNIFFWKINIIFRFVNVVTAQTCRIRRVTSVGIKYTLSVLFELLWQTHKLFPLSLLNAGLNLWLCVVFAFILSVVAINFYSCF